MVIPNDHPVSKFMDEFFIHWDDRRDKGIEMILNDMLKTNSQVWTNNNHRELATQTFISIGVNLLLVYDDVNKGALDIAKTILVLEHYDSSEGPGLSSSL